MVKFRTTLDSSASQSLNSHDMRRLVLMEVILCVSFVLAGIVFIWIDEMGLGIFIIAFGLLFPLMLSLIVKQKQKSLNKSTAIISEQTVQEFEFYDDHYTVTTTSGSMYNATATAQYCYLFRVCETKTHYFLYVSPSQAEVVAKSGLLDGSIEQLNDIFARNLGPKFQYYKGK